MITTRIGIRTRTMIRIISKEFETSSLWSLSPVQNHGGPVETKQPQGRHRVRNRKVFDTFNCLMFIWESNFGLIDWSKHYYMHLMTIEITDDDYMMMIMTIDYMRAPGTPLSWTSSSTLGLAWLWHSLILHLSIIIIINIIMIIMTMIIIKLISLNTDII